MTNPITDQAPVLVHDDGPVRVVSLNRPARLNAINASLLVALN
jgi:enoyl-CoA hydratase/carnithine racemase